MDIVRRKLIWALLGLRGLSERRYNSTKLRKFATVGMVGEMFVTLRSFIFDSFQQITFKLGRFADSRALFAVVPTEFLKRVNVKSWKRSIIRRLQSGLWLKYCIIIIIYDLLLVEGTSPPCFSLFFSCEILSVLFLKNFSVQSIGLFKKESNETCRAGEGNAQSSDPWDMWFSPKLFLDQLNSWN